MQYMYAGTGYMLWCPDQLAAALEREQNNLKGFKDFHLKNGSSQGQNLALPVLCVPNSLDSHQPPEVNYLPLSRMKISPENYMLSM